MSGPPAKDSPSFALPRAQDGVDTINEAVSEAAGAGNWEELSCMALLLGSQNASSERIWTLEQLEILQDKSLPCWVLRPINEPGGPRDVLWHNKAAAARFGAPRPAEEVLKWWQNLPDKIRPAASEVLKTLHTTIIVGRQKARINMNLGKTLHQNWTDLPKELFARLREEAIDVQIDGKVEACYFCVVEKELSAEQLRSTALTTFIPIHSYLFSHTGELLYATHNACAKARADGFDNLKEFMLHNLLIQNGQPHMEAAQRASHLICVEKAEHHAVTLTNTHKGKLRHTLYEFWPARDPCDSLEPALVVSAMDVSMQRNTELELQSLKTVLQRHNTDLQQKMNEAVIKQAGLEKERLTLHARLKDALKLHMTPCTRLDASSPVDRTVAVLDGLLELLENAIFLCAVNFLHESAYPLTASSLLKLAKRFEVMSVRFQGRTPQTEDILILRNTLLQSTDLRRVSNLERQLKGNMSGDASQSLITLLQDSNLASKRLARQLASPSSTPRRRSDRFMGHMSPFGSRRVDVGPPPVAPLHEVDRLLMKAESDWGFDMVALDNATNGHSLSCFGYWLMQRSGLLDRFEIPENIMSNCLRAIENGYQDNQYHNRIHAASVLHMSQMLVHCDDGLAECGITEHTLEFSMYMAAICHDYEHPGVTNDFLIKSNHSLARCYNDRSPLENYHASAALQVLSDHWQSEHYKMDQDLSHTVRSAMIELILATDMKQHFSLVARLQGAFQSGEYSTGKVEMAKEVEPNLPGMSEGCTKAGMSMESRLLAIQVALKCADVGHLALPERQHKMWVDRLQEEFFAQGDREREAGMAVSALMERSKASKLSSSQVGFFEVVALPLLRSTAAVVPGAQTMLEAASHNYMMWRNNAETSHA